MAAALGSRRVEGWGGAVREALSRAAGEGPGRPLCGRLQPLAAKAVWEGGCEMSNWLIYGANGYTGALIAREAVRRGLRPVLAGRDAPAVAALANELGLEARAFPLDDAASL